MPFQPKLTEIQAEQRQFLDHHYAADVWSDQRSVDLHKGLLAFSGSHTLIPAVEEDIDRLLERGQLWGATSKMMKGAPSQCHMNSCLLWEANQEKNIFVATGYALSDDGLWRQHSWCVNVRPRSVQIIETTVKREAYFGYVLNYQETLDFGEYNTDFGLAEREETRKRYADLDDPTAKINKALSPR